MLNNRPRLAISEFLHYLAVHPQPGDSLPSLSDLSRELGISVAALREQLEVARAMGLVDVKPRTGVRRKPYSFTPAVRQSLKYALALDEKNFIKFTELRNHVEAAYWEEAVNLLSAEDKAAIGLIVGRAMQKLRGSPVQVPHEEHRLFHLSIYNKINNAFVTGILEAYWDAYEAVGLNLYTGGIDYLEDVWQYHHQMYQAIMTGDLDSGRQALIEHVDLLAHRPR